VGPRAGLDMVVKRRIPSPLQESSFTLYTSAIVACKFGILLSGYKVVRIIQ
jgi:hypothetical protein